jgi:Flp pilus assembly protein TadB
MRAGFRVRSAAWVGQRPWAAFIADFLGLAVCSRLAQYLVHYVIGLRLSAWPVAVIAAFLIASVNAIRRREKSLEKAQQMRSSDHAT